MGSSVSGIDRLLIANRGEIAVRVIRACRELGIQPVAIYGDGDEQALHVRLADDAFRIESASGEGLPYLNAATIVETARIADAQAVHPGYGFLAENAEFAHMCADAGLTFAGPSPAAIRAMGDKIEARAIARRAGVPITAGSDGPVGSVPEALAWAEANGYPVAVKASGGGGGRGFRVARYAAEMESAFTGSSGEALRYFANPDVYLERYLDQPRHIEIQLFADRFGSVVALGERDCSVQRRHQKLIEETPSPAVTEAIRDDLQRAAIALARAVNYEGAGTVEFMLSRSGEMSFLEMNTRIQVEHTVTEEVTGIDLVKEQILVAAGRQLSFSADDVETRGHAIQCRINAELPERDFAPSPGTISALRLPMGFGVRVDTALETGSTIHPAYDSMIAKIVATGRNRLEALARMARALRETVIEGVPSTLPFQLKVIEHAAFQGEGATTAFIEQHPELFDLPAQTISEPSEGNRETSDVLVEVNGRRFMVRLPSSIASRPEATGRRPRPPRGRDSSARRASSNGTAVLSSPIQGTVIRVIVEEGSVVEAGGLICVVEAMKMENEIVAHRAGRVTSLAIQTNATVKVGAEIATIEDLA